METADNPTLLEREQLFMRLYQQVFPVVAKYVSKRGGNLEQAKEVFQEALILYYEKVIVDHAELRSSDAAYLMGIAKHLWFQLCATGHLTASLTDTDTFAMEEQEEISDHKLLHLLETTGKKCLDMLKAFYYDKLNMSQVAEMFGYATERSATVQKYKCMESVRDTVKQKHLQYEDFLA